MKKLIIMLVMLSATLWAGNFNTNYELSPSGYKGHAKSFIFTQSRGVFNLSLIPLVHGDFEMICKFRRKAYLQRKVARVKIGNKVVIFPYSKGVKNFRIVRKDGKVTVYKNIKEDAVLKSWIEKVPVNVCFSGTYSGSRTPILSVKFNCTIIKNIKLTLKMGKVLKSSAKKPPSFEKTSIGPRHKKETIFAHAPSRIVFEVPHGMRIFTALGMGKSGKGLYAYVIEADGKEIARFKETGKKPNRIEVKLPIGTRKMTLVVDPLDSPEGDWGAWSFPCLHVWGTITRKTRGW